MFEAIHILPDWMTMGHRLVIQGRIWDGKRAWLNGDGEWIELTEADQLSPLGIRLPEGALDAIVAKHTSTRPPQAATERHLEDACAIRDRLLTLLEGAQR